MLIHFSKINLIFMWKAVGTVNQNDNKKNRSKDQVNCQPFAQASRLRLNESQLSGHQSHPFMNQYFTKRKSSDSTLQRVLSQKTIQVKQNASSSASLRQIQSPRNINKTDQILGGVSIETDSLIQIQKKETCNQKKIQSEKGTLERKYQKIEEQLRKVKEEQLKITKFISQEIDEFRYEMKNFQKEIEKKMEMQNQKNIHQNINPQLLAKIKQEGVRFNQKMKDLDLRKQQLKERYKDKLRKE